MSSSSSKANMAERLFDSLDLDKNGELSTHEVADFAKGKVNVSKLKKALGIESGGGVSKKAFVAKYVAGELAILDPIIEEMGVRNVEVAMSSRTAASKGGKFDLDKDIYHRQHHTKERGAALKKDCTAIMLLMTFFSNMVMDGPVEEHTGPKPTPDEAGHSLLTNLSTKVLATVRCGGWKQDWCCGMLNMLFATFPRCSNVICNAVKGGPASDDEILMFCDIMTQLGFTCTIDAQDTSELIYWLWNYERSDGSWYNLNLYQYKSIEYAPPEMFRQFMGIMESESVAPELKRFVMMSAPTATLKGESVNDALNESITTALEWTKENMASKGWMPEAHHTQGAAASAAYDKYFDL